MDQGLSYQAISLCRHNILTRYRHHGHLQDPATGGFSFPYLFSKSAIGQATASLAHELLPLGIRVNGIAPGMFATGMTTGPDGADAAGISHFPKDRVGHDFAVPVTMRADHESAAPYGTARDMGAVVLALVANWFVCGETVLIDGGVNSQPYTRQIVPNRCYRRSSNTRARGEDVDCVNRDGNETGINIVFVHDALGRTLSSKRKNARDGSKGDNLRRACLE